MVNPFKQCQELRLKPWQCPPFLFILMGAITITSMLATYLIASKYDNLAILVISVSLVTIVIMTIGYFVVQGVNRIVEVNQLKTEFISVASHQLRTPLTGLKWSTNALKRTELNSKQKSLLQTIEESNQRMLNLVNNLLNVSRAEQGKIKLNKQDFLINKSIGKIIREFKPLARARNIKINFDDKKLKIHGDEVKLSLSIENLIHNAILYSQEPGEIEIKIKKNIISIKDNGVGIPKEQQKMIFNKFFRSNNVLKRQTQGSGLGLYISKAFIEAHKGKIWFKSKENQGTSFFIKLPPALS